MSINRIKEVLEEKGIIGLRPSNKQLVEMGTTIHTWNKWINKKLDPELRQLEPLAEFLGCSINELVSRVEVTA